MAIGGIGGGSLGGYGSGGQGGWTTGGANPAPLSTKPGTGAVGSPTFAYCPQGTTEVPPTSAGSASPFRGMPSSGVCPEGSIKRTNPNRPGGTMCCASSASGGGIDLGGITGGGRGRGPGGGGGGGAGGGNVDRPNLTPIDPNAQYDPEMQAALANMRKHEGNLEQGTGRVMDVMTQRQADDIESQVAQARAAAQSAGIPFDEAAFRANAMKGLNAVAANTAMERERQLGEQYKTTGQMAGAQAGERNQRLELDYKRDVSENELMLDRYGRDIQKYGIDVQAATAANNALLAFYSQLMGGMFGMMGNLGGSSMSQSNSYYYG